MGGGGGGEGAGQINPASNFEVDLSRFCIFFPPIFLSSNSFFSYLFCSIFCSLSSYFSTHKRLFSAVSPAFEHA